MLDDQVELPEFVGFVLRHVPGVAYAYLPATPGLTVLYGLNGAGKSRILEAVRSIWEGERSGAAALVRVPRCDPPKTPGIFTPFLMNLAQAWKPSVVFQGVGGVLDEDFEDLMADVLWQNIQPRSPQLPDPFRGPLPENRLESIHREMLDQRLVLITPTGNSGTPAWTVAFAVMEDERFPAISAELSRVREGDRLNEERVEGRFVQRNYDEETQLLETVMFEDFGDLDSPGPVIGVPLTGDDHRYDFQLTHLGLDRMDPSRDDLALLSKETIAEGGVWDGEAREVATSAKAMVADLERRANERYASVLRDAPSLSFDLKDVRRWFREEPVEWRFGPDHLPLSAMSTAQRYWANFAIRDAVKRQMYRHRDLLPSTLLLLDEPEVALHRSAEAQMARALSQYAREPGQHVMVATHSPELIDAPGATVLEVERRPGTYGWKSHVSALRKVDHDALDALGLLPSDLLRRQRGFILVEGIHDEVLLRTWIGAELDALRIEILPLRGGRKLPGTIESTVLFDHSDAHLFAILDAIDAEQIQSAWREAQLRYLADGPEAAGAQLRAAIWDKPPEREWLATWLSRALDKGRRERVTPCGLAKDDIVEYLPVGALVPGARSKDWDQLRAEHAKTGGDFKAWLRRVKAGLDQDRLERAALDAPVPEEITDFLELARQTLDGSDADRDGSR